MLDLTTRRPALLAAAAFFALTTHARAEPGVLSRDGDGCVPMAPCETPGTPCGDGGSGECAYFSGGTRLCAPLDAIFCCGRQEDCPWSPDATDLRCTAVAGGPGSLCLEVPVPDLDAYCAGAADPDVRRVRACHTYPDGTFFVPWHYGDCDGDGLTNEEELLVGTDPCAAPPPLEVAVGESCVPVETGCIPDGMPCPTPTGGLGACITDGLAGTYCVPDDATAHCCARTACPDDGSVCLDVGGLSVCTAPPDPPDGGGTLDGGTDTTGLPYRFEGGGGCACRAGFARSSGLALLALPLALGLLRRRR